MAPNSQLGGRASERFIEAAVRASFWSQTGRQKIFILLSISAL